MPYEFKIVRRVAFSDTDLAGIMHFSNFFKFMESAEHAFYRSLGFSVTLKKFDPSLGLPRVHTDCDFRRPLRFEDEVEVHLIVQKKTRKSIRYQFRFRILSSGDTAEVAARGSVTVVCIKRQSDGSLSATHLPQEMAALIEVAPADLSE